MNATRLEQWLCECGYVYDTKQEADDCCQPEEEEEEEEEEE